jgi:hypothetical protein
MQAAIYNVRSIFLLGCAGKEQAIQFLEFRLQFYRYFVSVFRGRIEIRRIHVFSQCPDPDPSQNFTDSEHFFVDYRYLYGGYELWAPRKERIKFSVYFPSTYNDTTFRPFSSGMGTAPLKVHKIENFFGSEFEFCTISLLVLL